jgi:uncharacterized repeat protein (TIGR01451 family)
MQHLSLSRPAFSASWKYLLGKIFLLFVCISFFTGSAFAANLDIGVTAITAPSGDGVFTEDQSITIEIKNFGDYTFNGRMFVVRYQVDSGPIVQESPSVSNFAPGSTVQFTFQQKANFFVPKSYHVTATTDLMADENSSNNAASLDFTSKPVSASNTEVTSFPYFEDFESGDGNWTVVTYGPSLSTTFALNTPNISRQYINLPASGTKTWTTGNSSFTTGGMRSQVISPIFDLRGIALATVSLKVAWESPGKDGAKLQQSTDDGATWTDVGTTSEPNNWYNASGITALDATTGTANGWTGYMTAGSSIVPYDSAGGGGYSTAGTLGSNGYVTASHSIIGGSKSRLRVLFAMSSGNGDEGFAFDDVSINSTATATQTDSLTTDQDHDGRADPGDVLTFTATVSNSSGADLTNVGYTNPFSDANLILKTGSVHTSQGTVTTGNNIGETTIAVDLGTVPDGETATVTFEATVGSLSSSVSRVCSQGTMSSDQFSVSTDDSNTSELGDATCASAFIDQDNDGVADSSDICPAGDDQLDTDHDGTPDACDVCPSDANKATSAGTCGCGQQETDANHNGVIDCVDPAPRTSSDGTCVSGGRDCSVEKLSSTGCAPANGFLGQVNILSVHNQQATPLEVSIRYYDSSGVQRGDLGITLPAMLKQDFNLDGVGLQADSYGTVCVTTNGSAGGWTGGNAIYRPSPGAAFGDSFDYAMYFPLATEFVAPESVPLNTFHLGTNPNALVANWISIADAKRGDGHPLTGVLHYYGADGTEVSSEAVFIVDGGRQDFAGHSAIAGSANVDAVGTARFVPDEITSGQPAHFFLTATRYFYDCTTPGCSTFLTAFDIKRRPATANQTFSSVTSKDGLITVTELNNFGTVPATGSGEVDSAAAASVGGYEYNLPAHGTQHVLLSTFGGAGFLGADNSGSATVRVYSGAVSATAVFYKLDAAGKLLYAYSTPYVGAVGTELSGQFNSYIQHKNADEIVNSGSQTSQISVQYLDLTGASVFSQTLSLAGGASTTVSPVLPSDNYGTTSVTADHDGVIVQHFIERQDQYKMSIIGR